MISGKLQTQIVYFLIVTWHLLINFSENQTLSYVNSQLQLYGFTCFVGLFLVIHPFNDKNYKFQKLLYFFITRFKISLVIIYLTQSTNYDNLKAEIISQYCIVALIYLLLPQKYLTKIYNNHIIRTTICCFSTSATASVIGYIHSLFGFNSILVLVLICIVQFFANYLTPVYQEKSKLEFQFEQIKSFFPLFIYGGMLWFFSECFLFLTGYQNIIKITILVGFFFQHIYFGYFGAVEEAKIIDQQKND